MVNRIPLVEVFHKLGTPMPLIFRRLALAKQQRRLPVTEGVAALRKILMDRSQPSDTWFFLEIYR